MIRESEIVARARAADVEAESERFALDPVDVGVIRQLRVIRKIVGCGVNGVEPEFGAEFQHLVERHPFVTKRGVKGVEVATQFDARLMP